MTSFRAVWPGFIGLILLFFGITSLAAGVQSGDPGQLADHIRTSAIPNGLGLGMVLAALAIRRRTRLGLLLGIVIGLLMAAAGAGLVILELGYLKQGGEAGAFASALIPVFAVWALVWLLYIWRLWAARSTFAPTLGPGDRRLGTVVAAVVVLGAAMWFGAGAYQAAATTNAIETDEQARAMVEATSFEVRVAAVSITPASGQSPAKVDRLTIEVELGSQQEYALAAPPTLCLTSLAWFQLPTYKPGIQCWAMPAADDSLRSAFASLTVPRDPMTVTLELDGAGSPCLFAPGMWNADLTLPPVLGGGIGDVGPAPMQYSLDKSFQVGDGSVAPPPSGSANALEDCLGVSP